MKTVVAGALGECVQVVGVTNFLHLAQQAGWRTVYLGPAVLINKVSQYLTWKVLFGWPVLHTVPIIGSAAERWKAWGQTT
jgi:hypothetical protein